MGAVLAVVDDCTRGCLALVGDTSISGIRVARELLLMKLCSARSRTRVLNSKLGATITTPRALILDTAG